MKTFFILKDNVLDKKLALYIEQKSFSHRKKVSELIQKFVKFYAKHFTKNNTKRAQNILENHHHDIRRKDAVLISSFSGANLMLLLITIFLLAIPASDGSYEAERIYSSFPSFRLTFMMIFLMVGTATVIKIFKMFKVNYLFIFELDPNYKLTHVQIFRVSITCATRTLSLFRSPVYFCSSGSFALCAK